jgi:hypothetical protein
MVDYAFMWALKGAVEYARVAFLRFKVMRSITTGNGAPLPLLEELGLLTDAKALSLDLCRRRTVGAQIPGELERLLRQTLCRIRDEVATHR